MIYPEQYRCQLFYKLHLCKNLFGNWAVYYSIHDRGLPISTGSTPQEAWRKTISYLEGYKVFGGFAMYLDSGCWPDDWINTNRR